MTKQNKEILNLIAQAIYDKKGFNILALNVQQISTMGDYLLIADDSLHNFFTNNCVENLSLVLYQSANFQLSEKK